MMRKRIDKSKLLLVEGKDEINFFEAYLSYLNILTYEITPASIRKLENELIDITRLNTILNRSFQWEELNNILENFEFKPYEISKIVKETCKKSDIQIEEAGGIHQFKNKFEDLSKIQGFKSLEVIGIIRDAEKNRMSAFDSICDTVKGFNLKPPSEGKTFSDGKPAIGIFIMPGNSDVGMLENLCLETVINEPAMNCVNSFIECTKTLSSPPKNIEKARVQAFLAAMPEIRNSLGLGAQKGYWNFSSDKLSDLREFICRLK